MVAVASASAKPQALARGRALGWTVGAAVVLAVGVGVRLVLGGAGVGDRSAIVMLVLLSLGVWLAARVLSGPRLALLALVPVVALLDLAALPARNAPAYDDLQAFYTTDQVLTTTLAAPSAGSSQVLTVLAQPVYSGEAARFGLAGEVNGTPVAWNCAFERGIHTLSLPLASPVTGSAEVRLHLTGAPARDGDYLVVYASSIRGGFLVSLEPADQGATTRCTLA